MFGYIFILSILIVYSFANQTSPCGDWAAYKDEKCFKVFDNLVIKKDAESVCIKQNAIHASIKSADEQDVINKYLKTSKIEDNIWISIEKTSTSWKWSDKTDVEYKNWAKDRPLKNTNDLNCVEVTVDEANYGKWIDDKCGKKNAVLCQKDQPWSVSKLQDTLLETRRTLMSQLDIKQKQIDSQRSDLVNLKTKTIPDQQKVLDSHKTDLNNLKLKIIPSQQKMIDSQKSEINALKSNQVPIGFVYVQLSGQSEPNTLWPNTKWENISPKYSGLFFRAEGGKSSAFGQIQNQQTQDLQILSHAGNFNQFNYDTWYTIKDSPSEQYLRTGGKVTAVNDHIGVKITKNNTEIYPRNQAIRIWTRIK